MKPGIIALVVGFALVAFTVADAQGDNGRTLSVSLSGSSFITSSENGVPTPVTQGFTSMQSGLAKGSGNAVFTVQSITQEPLPDARCPAELPFGNAMTSTFVLTYDDGSILSGATTAGSFFCSDGVTFVANLAGNVTGGEGRFEGATGTWESIAETVSARVTADVTIDLD